MPLSTLQLTPADAASPLTPADSCNLSSLKKGECAVVTGLDTHDDTSQPLLQRLMELGFVPGETVRVLAEAFPRRDPIAVRIGSATFALRRREAALIQVARQQRLAA